MTEQHDHNTQEQHAQENTRQDVVYVDATATTVSCCGTGVRDGGHPRVYLPVRPEKGYVICPYCHRRFVRKDSRKGSWGIDGWTN